MPMQFRHRVLTVDDDPGIRNITTMLLQVNNYDVSAVENGIEALSVLRNQRPHVMISDIRMPYMDGYEFAVRAEILPCHGRHCGQRIG